MAKKKKKSHKRRAEPIDLSGHDPEEMLGAFLQADPSNDSGEVKKMDTATEVDPMDKEFKYFVEHHDELVEKHCGKVVVIINEQVFGVYDDYDEAIEEAGKDHELGTFVISRVTPGDNDYTAILHLETLMA